MLVVTGESPSGGHHVLRRRSERLEVGEIRPLESGKSLVGEVIKLTPRESPPGLYDVEVLLPAPGPIEKERSRSGPAQVASESYRAAWERIFGRLGPSPRDPPS